MHPSDIQYCVDVVKITARRSRARRAQVGCVIWDVRKRSIVSMGYNGTPAGTSNVMEVDDKTLPEVIHAEANALRKLSRFAWFSRPYVLFVTHLPCLNCAKMILQYPIQQVYYLENYGSAAGLNVLRASDIAIHRLFAP